MMQSVAIFNQAAVGPFSIKLNMACAGSAKACGAKPKVAATPPAKKALSTYQKEQVKSAEKAAAKAAAKEAKAKAKGAPKSAARSQKERYHARKAAAKADAGEDAADPNSLARILRLHFPGVSNSLPRTRLGVCGFCC